MINVSEPWGVPLYEAPLLQSFLAVERTGGFTAAAQDLGVRQSTISAHIAKLEQQVGRSLFDRNTHRVELTPDGSAMLGFARDILTAQENAHSYFSSGDLSGHILFGASEDLVAQELPQLLLEFGKAYPLVDLDLRVGLSETLHRQVQSGQLDLAFVKRRPGEQHGSLVFTDELVWAGRPESVVDPGRPIPLITYPPPSLTRQAALDTLQRANLGVRITCVSDHQLGLRAAALAGLGYLVHAKALLPEGLAPIDALPSPGNTEFVLINRPRPLAEPARELAKTILSNADRLAGSLESDS